MAKKYGNNIGYTNFYIGRRGSGKTQQAVIDAYEAYQEGQIIISNIWLNFPHIRFQKIAELVPILKEIAEYNHNVVVPTQAPLKMVHEYGMKRKYEKNIKQFFILIDEIGKHLNSRNWQKNFKDELLVDMLTEPRKYNMTIIGVAQAWKRVDVQFREMTEDWYVFKKEGFWIFERMHCSQLWVHDGELDFENPIVVKRWTRWITWNKIIHFFRTLYYTKEIVGAGVYEHVPHRFIPGTIFVNKNDDDDASPDSPFLLTDGTLIEEQSDEAPTGVER